ncbi:hypothetical protein [Nitrosopumilus maritimus]|uniref:Uncharacterized protein n=1 Tax=Nitrosopumilus maritimus (strain SCM1) TaxID=436308 RepID=A9A2W0_NITMS|nr:hypothetical protein [Nitrosopumilus maritimus]ABX13637.1 hypothetical protein Nmar_1741 [Nitrosopumilus maritimus SCM1]
MNSKIFAVLVIVSLVAVIPTAYAQVSIAEKADQKLVEVRIDLEGNVHVTHVIDDTKSPKQVDLISGTVSNISVIDKQGGEKQFSVVGDNNAVLILPSNEDSILQYELDDVISEINDIWTWDFLYLESTSFILPEEVDLVFVNERPVYLGDMKGINCHGCQMLLEYSINKLQIKQNVEWEDKQFLVEIVSNSNVDNFVFDQPSKSIAFDVSEKNRFVNTVIPLELLWGPYSVFLDDEKMFYQEYFNNGTHVWVTIVPETSGEVTIIGTTVVPEFSIMLPLIIGFFVILAMPFMKKFNLR